MEMLPEGKKNSVQVTLADQKRINEFSKLVLRKDTAASELARQRREKEYLDDVSLEIELVDEDEKVQYRIGELFVFLPQAEVVAQLEKDMAALDERIAGLEDKEAAIDERIGELKGELYAKFGDNINLER